MTDATEEEVSKRASEPTEERLMESERRFDALMNNLPGVVYRCRNDRDWTMEYLSGGCERLVGYRPEEILNNASLSYNDLIHPEDRPAVWDSVESALEKREPYRMVYRVRTSQGDIKWVWEQGSGIFGDSGEVIALEGFITDITEQKRAQEALKEREEFLSSIVENIPDTVFIKDANRELKYARINRAGERLLGYTRDEIIGRNDYDFFPKEQADFFASKDFEALRSGKVQDIPEEPVDTKAGRRILRTKKIPLMDREGKPAYLLGIAEDITERKREQEDREKLRAQLVQAQKMESIGRLAGGVAHDFNNMLGVIMGYAELALKRVSESEPVYLNLQEIRKAAERSAALTRQLLAFARRQTVAPKVLDLNETVEGMLKMLRRLIGEDISLAWLPAAGLWPVKIDPSQIDQILANLCVNARDAIDGVGKVTIETQSAVFDTVYRDAHPGAIPGEYVLLAVSDNGRGMAKEVMESIFEPFYTTKGMEQGTGLGLATVYGIVKQNQGFINVYSEPGQGTTFKIYLPRHRIGNEEAIVEKPAPLIRRGHEAIMLVEDDQAILKMGKLILESLGYRVLAAGTPSEALDLAKKHASGISLLITDVVMPEMNGKDLANKLTPLCPGIRILFVSGYTSNVIAHHGILDEGVNFIQKPFSMDALGAKVREVLDAPSLPPRDKETEQ